MDPRLAYVRNWHGARIGKARTITHTFEVIMRNPLGIILLVVGVLLLIFGISASDSIGSSFSKLFTGAPTDKAIWLLISGVVAIAIGATVSVRGSRAS